MVYCYNVFSNVIILCDAKLNFSSVAHDTDCPRNNYDYHIENSCAAYYFCFSLVSLFFDV